MKDVYHSISGTKRQKDARTVSRNVYIVCFGDSGSVYSWKWDVKLPNYPVRDTEFITWTRAEPNPIDFQGLWPVNCFREVLSRSEKKGKAGVAARCDAWKVKRASELHRMTTQAIIVWQNLRPWHSNIMQHTAQHGFPDSESKLTCFTCHPNCKLRHGLSERIFLAKMVAKCLEPNHFLFDGIWQKCGCVLGFYGYVMICADRIWVAFYN